MSWGLEVLALGEDADERTIKRAYAQRLRVTRPDDDPAAFQRLHEAYQAALAWVQQRPVPVEAASAASAHVASGPEPAPEPAPAPASAPADRAFADAPPPPPQTVDVAASAHGILARALQLEPGPLRDWLAQQPELWSLYSKPAIGEVVLAQLCNHVPPLSMGISEVLVETFGWNDLHSGIDPYALHAHRLQMHRSWVVQPRNHGRLAELLRQNGLPSTVTSALRTRPALAGLRIATMRSITPDLRSRCRRRRQLEGDSPTSSAISTLVRDASFCKRFRSFRSIRSMPAAYRPPLYLQ